MMSATSLSSLTAARPSSSKAIYEYRVRAGHYSKVLFKEPEFHKAVDLSRWRAFLLGLAMVAEIVEGVIRSQAGGD